MPRTKKQELIFSLLMVFFMVYAMICYNIALNVGSMSNQTRKKKIHFIWCWRSPPLL